MISQKAEFIDVPPGVLKVATLHRSDSNQGSDYIALAAISGF